MTDSTATSDDEGSGLSPDEAFALLGNETRIEILRALWAAHEPFADDAVSFSDLRERVGVRDSGQFNYHLEKLTGQFVERTDEGYELRHSGLEVVYAILSGTATEDPTLPPTEVDAPCPFCDAPTTIAYEDERLTHACTECEGVHGSTGGADDGVLAVHPFSPAGLADRSPDAVLAAERIQAKHQRAMMVEGVCPACSGAVDPDLRVCADHDDDGVCANCGALDRLQARYTCSVCRYAWRLGPKLRVATHPAVVGFYYEHGIEFDIASDGGRLAEWESALVAEDPIEVRVTVPCEGDRLDLTLDERLDVVEVGERRS